MVLPIAFAAINRSLITGISFAMCFIAMTTGYTFSITEKNDMERLYGILPVSKRDFVIGRYMFVITMGVIALTFSLIVQPMVLKSLGETVNSSDIMSAAIVGIFLFALYTVFQLPGYYKLGSIKGRVFMYIPVVGFLATLLLITKIPVDSIILIDIISNSLVFFTSFIVIVIILMYIISTFISIKILKSKEM